MRFTFQEKLPIVEADFATSGIVYVRCSSGSTCLVKKIVYSDTKLEVYHAYGTWNDRATLEYIPIDQGIEIQA